MEINDIYENETGENRLAQRKLDGSRKIGKNDNARKSETASVQERDGEKSIGRGRDGRGVNSSRSDKALEGEQTRQSDKRADPELTRIAEASISNGSTQEKSRKSSGRKEKLRLLKDRLGERNSATENKFKG